MYRYDAAQRIIFHIIAEYHQLRNVDETAEFLIGKAFFVHSCALCQHSTVIVGLFTSTKTKWQPIYEQSNVRAKFILSVPAGKFGCEMERIIPDVIKVYQLDRRNGFETIVKSPDRDHHRSVPCEYLSKLEETLPRVRDSDS